MFLAWILFDKETTDCISHLRRLMKDSTRNAFIAASSPLSKSLRNTYCDKCNMLAELVHFTSRSEALLEKLSVCSHMCVRTVHIVALLYSICRKVLLPVLFLIM